MVASQKKQDSKKVKSVKKVPKQPTKAAEKEGSNEPTEVVTKENAEQPTEVPVKKGTKKKNKKVATKKGNKKNTTAVKEKELKKTKSKDSKPSTKNSKKKVKKDVEIDEEARYTGQCVFYNRDKGFGFIKIDETGLLSDDKVMAHWKDIKTNDRWPHLVKNLKVEIGLQMKNGEVRAKEISLPGGAEFDLLEQRDEKMDFVGDKNTRYLGNVKFYDLQKGFGFVTLQDGYDIDASIPTEFRINRSEICVVDGAVVRLRRDMEIEFGIMKNKAGTYSCYNITMPGGEDITRTLTEARSEPTDKSFKGKVSMWSWNRGGFGYIEPDSTTKFPANIEIAMKAHAEKLAKKEDAKAGKNGIYFRRSDADTTRFQKGQDVEFHLYTDASAQGFGACQVVVV